MTAPGGQWGGGPQPDFVRFMEEGFRRLERGLENIQNQLGRLPRDYVSRIEFDRYRDEQMIDLASALNRHERDIVDVKTEMRDIRLDSKEIADRARAMRLWVIGLVIATVVALPGSIFAIASLFH